MRAPPLRGSRATARQDLAAFGGNSRAAATNWVNGRVERKKAETPSSPSSQGAPAACACRS